MIYHSDSPQQTAEIAKRFADTLRGGEVICMNGDLGVGKTVFVQALAKALGIEDYINSPTFTIVNQYEGRLPLYHFDVYRINDCEEMYDIGYDEYIGGNGVCVIEWAENIKEILPDSYCKITILKDYEKGDDYRLINIENRGV